MTTLAQKRDDARAALNRMAVCRSSLIVRRLGVPWGLWRPSTQLPYGALSGQDRRALSGLIRCTSPNIYRRLVAQRSTQINEHRCLGLK